MSDTTTIPQLSFKDELALTLHKLSMFHSDVVELDRLVRQDDGPVDRDRATHARLRDLVVFTAEALYDLATTTSVVEELHRKAIDAHVDSTPETSVRRHYLNVGRWAAEEAKILAPLLDGEGGAA